MKTYTDIRSNNQLRLVLSILQTVIMYYLYLKLYFDILLFVDFVKEYNVRSRTLRMGRVFKSHLGHYLFLLL